MNNIPVVGRDRNWGHPVLISLFFFISVVIFLDVPEKNGLIIVQLCSFCIEGISAYDI